MATAPDLAFIIDHLTADCGVRFRYAQLIRRCKNYGLKIALVADHKPEEFPDALTDVLVLKVDDERSGVKFKRRPFISLSTESGEETVDPGKFCGSLGLNREDALWLDAWKYSSEWIAPTSGAIQDFIQRIKPQQTVVATQSFLGFSATTLDLSKPSVSFHTDYGAFYASRLSGNNDETFGALKKAINNRIVREFFPRFPMGFVSSYGTITEYDESELMQGFHEFPGGVDTRLFVPSLKRKKDKRIKVLFVGRLSEEKGTRLLIEAAAKLNRENIDWTIVGNGMEKELLQKSLPFATFRGALPQAGVSQVMAESDIFIFLGRWDTFGLSALEAMACAVPVISVGGSGIARIIERSAAGIVISHDTTSLTEAITLLSQNSQLREQMGRNGRHVAEQMTWEKVCDYFLNKLGYEFPRRKS